MSESRAPFFEPSFNRSLKVRSRDSRLTSDAGAVLLREADEILDSVASLSRRLYDPRRPDRIRYTLEELLRERIYGLALGYRVADDLDHLAHDPAMRIATWVGVGDRVVDERLASQPTQSRLIDYLSGWKSNVESVREAAVDLVANHIRASGRGHGVLRATLDVDSFPVVARGLQAGSEYNGHYHGRVFHPLVAGFAPNGIYDSDRVGGGFVHAILRGGSAASQQGALRFIRNAVKKCRQFGTSLDVRVDAAFTKGWIIDGLTDDRIRFVGRLADNPRLERLASEYVYRPVGRPPSEGYEYTVELGSYQAESWCHPQRVVLVVVDKPDPRTGQLNLFPYHFFLVTNWKECDMSSEQLLAHYRQRGTFEDRLGEFSQFVSANLSSPKFEEKAPQQNLWVCSGTGRAPRLW